jgi:hypothetical protein
MAKRLTGELGSPAIVFALFGRTAAIICNSPAVIDHSDDGDAARSNRSELIRPLRLLAQDESDLLAFLQAPTRKVDPTVPVLPRQPDLRHAPWRRS